MEFSSCEFKGWGRFCHVFTLETTRKAGELQILCCQGIAVSYPPEEDFTLDAWALKLSDFCNVRVYSLNPKKPKPKIDEFVKKGIITRR